MVDEWVTAIGLRPEESGAHSLRGTKASMIYKATGNLRAIRSREDGDRHARHREILLIRGGRRQARVSARRSQRQERTF